MTKDHAGMGDRVTAELRGPDGQLRQPVDETPEQARRAQEDEHAETRAEKIEER